jgi:DNA-binding response OmpR family regulator
MMHPEQGLQNSQPTERRRHILVVDDDPLFRSLMVGVLRRDFDVSVACDGADGFYRALESKPDVTVLDLQMPGWDGLKTLRAFRAHPALADVKVMVLTSDSSRETVLAAIHAGADDYTIKTAFSRDEFRVKLDRLTRHIRNETSMDTIIAKVMTTPEPTRSTIADSQSDTLSAISDRKTGWSGSNELLQEAIDAWE